MNRASVLSKDETDRILRGIQSEVIKGSDSTEVVVELIAEGLDPDLAQDLCSQARSHLFGLYAAEIDGEMTGPFEAEQLLERVYRGSLHFDSPVIRLQDGTRTTPLETCCKELPRFRRSYQREFRQHGRIAKILFLAGFLVAVSITAASLLLPDPGGSASTSSSGWHSFFTFIWGLPASILGIGAAIGCYRKLHGINAFDRYFSNSPAPHPDTLAYLQWYR